MSQSTVSPYPDLASQYASGLNTIGAGLPGSPAISDLVAGVYSYIASVYYSGTPSTQIQEEIKSISYSAINSYINWLIGSGQSALSPKCLPFANMLIGPAVSNNLPLYLTNWIGDVQDNISKSGLSVTEQRPLLMATEIGTEAYTYWKLQTSIGPMSPWYTYFNQNLTDYNTIPYLVAASMEGALDGYCASSVGLVEPTVNAATNTMMSALIGALTIAAGKLVFGWIGRIPNNVGGLSVSTIASLNGGMGGTNPVFNSGVNGTCTLGGGSGGIACVISQGCALTPVCHPVTPNCPTPTTPAAGCIEASNNAICYSWLGAPPSFCCSKPIMC